MSEDYKFELPENGFNDLESLAEHFSKTADKIEMEIPNAAFMSLLRRKEVHSIARTYRANEKIVRATIQNIKNRLPSGKVLTCNNSKTLSFVD